MRDGGIVGARDTLDAGTAAEAAGTRSSPLEAANAPESPRPPTLVEIPCHSPVAGDWSLWPSPCHTGRALLLPAAAVVRVRRAAIAVAATPLLESIARPRTGSDWWTNGEPRGKRIDSVSAKICVRIDILSRRLMLALLCSPRRLLLAETCGRSG